MKVSPFYVHNDHTRRWHLSQWSVAMLMRMYHHCWLDWMIGRDMGISTGTIHW